MDLVSLKVSAEQIIQDRRLSVLIAASEISPFAKTGGLGEVMGSLPEALSPNGARVSLIMPAYRCILNGCFQIEDTGIAFQVPVSNRNESATILKSHLSSGVPVYFVRSDKYFDRDNLYSAYGGDYPDNAERFVFFSRAIVEFLRICPHQILHANDWQTALSIAFLKSQPFRYPGLASVKTVMTIHNLGYQGRFRVTDWPLLNLDWSLFNFRYLEFYNNINFLKGGIVFADAITTVSPSYAEEIKTSEQGFGLEGVFHERSDRLFGILNGVDYKTWNPAIDTFIAHQYSPDNIVGKQLCKVELQKYFNLVWNDDVPLIGMVTRLSNQKGLDLVYQIIGDLIIQGFQFVLLGSGDSFLQDIFYGLTKKYPGRIGVEIGFREDLAHRIIAGSDILLMPSLYEPGGLAQLYGMKYGTIPIVRATGGLKDTVKPYDVRTASGNGFVFTPYQADSLLDAIDQASGIYRQKGLWANLMINAMKSDFSWKRSASGYMDIYSNIISRA
jgi:starch synthase